jgi:hypothetical protein
MMIYLYVFRLWACLASVSILLLSSCNRNNEKRKLSQFEADLRTSHVEALHIFEGLNSEARPITLSEGSASFWEMQIRRMELISPESEFAKSHARELVGAVTVRLKCGKLVPIHLMRKRGAWMTEEEASENFKGVFLAPSDPRSLFFRLGDE